MLHSTVSGQGHPLILLHGLFGMGSNLSMVAKTMAAHFQVFSLDLRNHGLSFHADSMAFSDMADDVLQFMNARQITRTHILGHSLGGKVAMQLALTEPLRLHKLVVADIAPVAYDSSHDAVFAAIEAVDVNAINARSEAHEVLKQYIDQESVRQFLLKNLYRTAQGRFDWRINVKALSENYAQMRQGLDAETPFPGPVLFIKAEHSAYLLPEHSAAIERLFSRASFKMIQNTGHWLHAEKPVAFNHIVREFLLA